MPESFPLSEASMVCFSFTPFPSLFACTSSSPPSSAGFFQIFRSFYPFHGCLRKVIRENTFFDTAVADVWCGKSNLLWQPHHHTEQRQPSVLLNTLTWLTWGFFLSLFIVIIVISFIHARTNNGLYLHQWHNAGNHFIPLDSDGLPVTRQRPTHHTEVGWLLVTQPACRMWSCDLTQKSTTLGDMKKDMTVVDAIIRSCRLTTWEDRHGWMNITCTHTHLQT